jgi:hypothetical protein
MMMTNHGTDISQISTFEQTGTHAIVQKSLSKARVLLTSMNKWVAELSILYALPSPTKAEIERRFNVESALLEYDGYFRDGGSLPNGEDVKLARKKAA